MPGKKSQKRDLDDIQVLGVWNFTIQPETPLVWLRTGPLDRYLLRFQIHSSLPSTAGMIFHSEADGPGIDGVSFWIERRATVNMDGEEELTRRYVLAGEGLESKPLATKKYPDMRGEAVEDVEVLVQGFTAVIFMRNRQVQIRCRTKSSRGSICFFNSTQATENGIGDDVHFSNCRITALRRGPLEVSGLLARREKALEKPPKAEDANDLDPLQADASVVFGDAEEKVDGFHDSVATTAATAFLDSPGVSTHLSKSAAATTNGTFLKTGSSPGVTKTGFRHTTTARGGFGKTGPSALTNSSSMFAGRPGASPARLRATFSDGALRKSGVALCGLSHASKARGFGGEEWVPLVANPPKSEMKFVREHAIRPSKDSRFCQDFIPQPLQAIPRLSDYTV